MTFRTNRNGNRYPIEKKTVLTCPVCGREFEPKYLDPHVYWMHIAPRNY